MWRCVRRTAIRDTRRHVSKTPTPSCIAFAMRSMEQPRHSRAERTLAVIDHTNVNFVARIRIFMLGTSLLPGQASRGGAISLGDVMSHCRCTRELTTLRTFSGTGGECESVAKPIPIPTACSIEHASMSA